MSRVTTKTCEFCNATTTTDHNGRAYHKCPHAGRTEGVHSVASTMPVMVRVRPSASVSLPAANGWFRRHAWESTGAPVALRLSLRTWRRDS